MGSDLKWLGFSDSAVNEEVFVDNHVATALAVADWLIATGAIALLVLFATGWPA